MNYSWKLYNYIHRSTIFHQMVNHLLSRNSERKQ